MVYTEIYQTIFYFFFYKQVVDIDTGAILGPNKSGELCIKGPLLMNGYCQNKDNVIQGIDEDGWLHTGDVAYFDEDLDFYIIDRIKELIKYKSFQVNANISLSVDYKKLQK